LSNAASSQQNTTTQQSLGKHPSGLVMSFKIHDPSLGLLESAVGSSKATQERIMQSSNMLQIKPFRLQTAKPESRGMNAEQRRKAAERKAFRQQMENLM
jgi:hypothetical protein